ncbi:BatA domain-containing protein, partial [Nitratireductor pacificus]
MNWLSLSFAQPFLLWGLIALPVIWWLLRLTPPRPQTETFPPLKILARVVKREETPHKSPWWLTLLRLLLAALVILALAEPVLNPREKAAGGNAALAVVMDNGWAGAPDWDERVATAARLIGDARSEGQPVVLALTAEEQNQEIGPFDADTALERLNAARPRPVPVNRPAIYGRVAAALEDMPGAAVAVLSDGLAATGDEAAFRQLFAGGPGQILWAAPERLTLTAATDAQNTAEAFEVTATRAGGDAAPRQVVAYASDDKGRRLAEAVLTFTAGATKTTGRMPVPFELRNDFVSVGIEGENQAAGLRVLDENTRRRRIGLLSQSEADQAQPLLSPLYYIERALSPFADLVEPSSAELTEAIPELLEQKPAVIVMADVGTLPEAARRAVIDWVDGGGTLLRFAGPRLAAADNDEDLLPVRLRLGERSLGGALSWTEPQPVAEFPASGPFSDLAPPRDVVVNRQVLAEPSPDIVERSWANLADGTPLVTGVKRGEGQIVLFHVTPEATWSNLPISGSFVEMLRRVVQLSRNQGALGEANAEGGKALAPYRMVSADGLLVPPSPEAEPLAGGGAVTLKNPPGLYGSEEGVVAHNLLPPDAELTPLARPEAPAPLTALRYGFDEQQPLKGPLFAAALALLALDTLAVLWLGGRLRRRP